MESWKTPRGVMSLRIHRQRLHLQSGSTGHRQTPQIPKGGFRQNIVYDKHPTSVVPRNVPFPRYHVQCGPVLLLMATLALCKISAFGA